MERTTVVCSFDTNFDMLFFLVFKKFIFHRKRLHNKTLILTTGAAQKFAPPLS